MYSSHSSNRSYTMRPSIMVVSMKCSLSFIL
jgi:hypothetical protein